MLKFLKRQSSQLRHNVTDLIHIPSRPDEILLNNSMVQKPMIQVSSLSDEELFNIDYLPQKEQYHFSKSLREVLKHKNVLSFFIQFMESHNALSYVQCWLDIEDFKLAIQNYGLIVMKPVVNNDSLSVSTDCDDSIASEIRSLNDDTNMTISNATSVSLSYDSTDRDSPQYWIQHRKQIQEFSNEAISIFKKYVALEAPESINCSDDIRNEIIENICSSQKILSIDCFEKAQTYVFNLMDKEYFEAFVHSDYFCKYQIDILTSGNVVLEDILFNETALFYFMEFLEQENNRNLLEFWLAATNFEQQLQNQKEYQDPIEAQNDAVILYDKYFSLQALCPLGFGDKIRFAVEEKICGEHGLTSDCFSLPLRMAEHVLNKHYLHAFLSSQLFYKYLSELINTVQSSSTDDRKLQSSECDSEKSFYANNTFLAMEVPNKKKNLKGNNPDMNIDTRELYDPDALWRRKKHNRLSFGRVTELGQFVTDFEPEPDKKTRSRLRSVVRRFVNLEEDKKKEELAWQVAEMIVKDVTSVTLSEYEQKSY